MVSLKWSSDALEDLQSIDVVIARRIVAKAKWLEENFPAIVPERLTQELKGLYKLRVGDYRIIYSVHGEPIIIQAVGNRRDIYKK